MAIDKQTVKRVAFLSRLKVDDDKIETTEAEFNKILQWIEQLNEVNTDGVEPLVSVNDSNITCREVVVTADHLSKEVMSNANEAAYGYFTVPKVIE